MYHKGGGGRPRGFGFEGFNVAAKKSDPQLGQSALPPESTPSPSLPVINRRGYTGLTTITQNAMDINYGNLRKRPKTEEEYFDQDDEDDKKGQLAYQPAPGSPSWNESCGNRNQHSSDSEEDPLDAFMAGIEKKLKSDSAKPIRGGREKDITKEKDTKGVRDDIENEDDEESYYRYVEENPNAAAADDTSDVEIEYDEDGNPIAPLKSKYIDPLPPIDHSQIEYKEFSKNFFDEPEDIARLTAAEVEDLRQKLGVKVTGACAPKPITSFAHFGFDEQLMKAIRKSEYVQPSPIQAQGVPIALSGRDMIGIAKTGSGKTAAFIWPMLVHIMDQRELLPGEGPIGLILAPTRELAQQIYLEAKRFGKVYNITAVCCFGGGSKWEQSKALEEGAEIVVATPGRMIDMIKMKATNLERVTMLVLDEADRMFDMGFEPQVRSICDHVRPDRQTLMFSATFKKKVERLARHALTDPIRVVQGDIGEANEDVMQLVLVMPPGSAKWTWLTSKLVELTSVGSVLIFVTKKANAEELATNLKTKDHRVGLLHGDMDQNDRTKVIASFKRKEFPILVATDVAARGLDIPHVKTVVNYDIARDIDTHTHRIGRTGRAGEKGLAYTLITEKEKEFAGHLVRNLEGANQGVPSALMDLAMQSSWFRKSRFKQEKGKKLNIGGHGLGFRIRERPGLGAPPPQSRTQGPLAGMGSYAASVLSAPQFVASSDKGSACSAPQPSAKTTPGPQSDRLSAMRAAFQSQYKSQFQAATDTSWLKKQRVPDPPSDPRPDLTESAGSKRRKKSRWDV
ncbi:ATP-dependent RNA helicase DDX42-like [Ornithodoros turicata]|uniref:ATP-dependent RNA helicase DDX42-like n=1 Tax=Ornithodoros turicata TaxID=34597 RepID=UPI003138CFF2